ncbi:MAG: transposase zinc-binding domain-containing protein [Thiobacillus sp.]
MIPLAEVIARHEAACLQQYRHAILPSHRQALAAMKSCRTALAPRMLARCSACDERRLVPHSCGHRNCPHCQHHESQQWLERQLKRQVPANYFLLTFTVPAEFILSCDGEQVSFRYRDSQTGEMAVRTVSGATFLWLILQHVLPKGFRRARNFGFLHPNSKRLIALLQVVLKVMPSADPGWMKPRPPFLCTCCGAPMQVVRRRIPSASDRWRSSSLAESVSM